MIAAVHVNIESLRLEKTSKIIKSNHQPTTTTPVKLCPEVPHLQGWGLPHCPGQPVPMSDHSSSKEIFLNIQSKPPLMQLEAISSRPIARLLGRRDRHPPHYSLLS